MARVYTYTKAEQFIDPSCLVAVGIDPMHSGRVPTHAHEFSEIVTVVAGSGSYRFGNHQLPARAGDVFVISPGEVHDLSANGSMQLNNFMCDRAAVLDGAFSGLSAFAALFDLLPHLRGDAAARRHLHLDAEELAAVAASHQRIARELAERGVAWRQRVVANFHDAVAILCRSWSRQYHDNQGAPLARLARVLAFIQAHLDEPLDLPQLAEQAHCSPGHLRRLFQHTFGQGPKAYILQRRLDHAAQLLRSSDEPITAIGLRCGFCDGNHFAKVFRQHRGQSPGAFRRGISNAGQ